MGSLRHRLASALAIALVGLLAASGAAVGENAAASAETGAYESAALAATRVRMKDDFFRPKVVTIPRGSRVKWVNRGQRPHTTTGPGWDKVLAPGERWGKRFRKGGTFRYVCTFHSGMVGKIIVV